MSALRFPARAVCGPALACALAAGCATQPAASPDPAPAVTAFTGATVWTGTGDPPIPGAVLVVGQGRIQALGRAGDVDIPDGARRVALDGHWIVPGLVNAHGHVGVARGLDTGEAAGTLANMGEQLALYARYGVTSVVSLDEPNYNGVELSAGNDAPDLQRARLHVSGPYMDPDTPQDVRGQLRERLARGVDWGKIRVDDQLGSREKMDPATYAEVVARAHEAGLPVTAHIVALEDAQGLVANGVDVIGHSVRDRPVDEDLVVAMREAGTCLHPTLTREVSTYVYRDRPEFFDDPFFLREADPGVVRDLQTPEVQARFTGLHAEWYRNQLPVAVDNMVRLHRGGVRIAFGTDSGPPARFQGYFEHMEMAMMQAAGLSPEEVLVSATRVAAECMRLEGVGVLREGAHADLLVVRGNPLEDVANLRRIEQVWIAGNPVPGARFEGE